jgi:shikimate dehydrogenase
MLYGLIGYPLTHSFSPAYFQAKFAQLGVDAAYKAFPLKIIDELPHLLAAHADLRGLNVTIPYKQAVIPYLRELDETAAKTGAVNCIAITGGKLKGYNTDVTGFLLSLRPLLRHCHRHALVLGTGGAFRAVTYVLDQLGISWQLVSRNKAFGALTYEDVTPAIIKAHTLIINTTPLGMYPDVDAAPSIPYEALTSQHLLYDLIYNPPETRFLSLGKAQGATIKNGLEMLHLQADASWEIWSHM